MPAHRAPRRQGSPRPRVTRGGVGVHRSTARGRTRALSFGSMIGTAALVTAAVGAIAASRPSAPDPLLSSPAHASVDVPTTPLPSLSQQAATLSLRSTPKRASRAGERPRFDEAQQAAAERQAAERDEQLEDAATSAQDYAERLARQWVLPTTGFHISVWFGEAGPYWASGHHTGIDFATACGTPVVAVADGVISDAGYDIGGWAYGNQIRLRLSNGDEVWYNHLSHIGVSTGQTVSKGETLGLVGETGNAYGCHLHFEYRRASDLHTAVDPLPYFNDHGIYLR